MPLRKDKCSIRNLKNLNIGVGTRHLTVQHTRHAPRVTVALRIIPEHRRGDAPAVARYILLELRLPLRRKGSLLCWNIQFPWSLFLSEYVGLQFIGAARHVAVGLERTHAIPLPGQ